MAKFEFQTIPKDDTLPLNQVKENGLFVLDSVGPAENPLYKKGNYIVVVANMIGIFTPSGIVSNGYVADKISAVRVRPMRPGESITCVE